MQLSVVDAQDIYMSAKAYTALTISELEAEWHKPALEKLAKMMTMMAKQQGIQLDQAAMPPEMEEDYGTY